MRNFVILLFLIFGGMWIADNVFANTLYDLYSDHSSEQTNVKKVPKTRQTNNNYSQNSVQSFSNPSQQVFKNPEKLMEKGSLNYGQYSQYNKRTNPVRIGNPYNHLNEKYTTTPRQAASSTVTFDGDAVTFKRGSDGNIYGYNKYGKKVGIYRINNNGTTTQYDTQGNKMGTFK